MKKLIPLLLVSLIASKTTFSQVIRIDTLCAGLLMPTCIQNTKVPGDNRLFINEKRGRIKIVNRLTGAVNATPFLDIYSRVSNVTTVNDERGLLGLAFHPDYANNGYFYVDYTNTSNNTVIARYQVSSFADTALTNSEQILLTIYQPFTNHNGGNLVFGPDGYLYISMGDGGSGGDPQNNGQDIDSLLAKILRIDVNNPNPPYYSSPPTNPFYGPTAGRDEIWAYGVRNPWRCSFDRMTGDFWIGDVGQNAYEEIDFQSRCSLGGEDYGWRCYEGDSTYNTTGCLPASSYVFPVTAYPHSLGCSITGGYVYRGGQEGGLFGKYLFTDYCQGRIWATVPNGSGGWTTSQLSQATTQINSNYSSWGEDIYGELYLAGVASGRIYRVHDTGCAPTAYINSRDTLINCTGSAMTFNAIYGTGLTYQWYHNVALVSTGQSYGLSSFSNGDSIYVQVSNGNCTASSNTVHIFTNASILGLDSLYCDTAPAVALTGIPAGGIFSGPGMSGNMFDPNAAGLGVHAVVYTLADTISNCYYNASGCILTDTQYVTVDVCTGIGENEFGNVSVYPNPNHAEFNVEFALFRYTKFTMLVTDALGRTIYEKNIEAERGKKNILVNLSGASEGVYFLFMKTERAHSVFKVIVQK